VLVEDDRGAAEAAACRTILQQDLLRLANTNCICEVIL
jgi:hypothetical protein